MKFLKFFRKKFFHINIVINIEKSNKIENDFQKFKTPLKNCVLNREKQEEKRNRIGYKIIDKNVYICYN